MSDKDNLIYQRTIRLTLWNAFVIQWLTLQDLKRGGFAHPRKTANPFNLRLVLKQLRNLQLHPDRYSGYTRGRKLVAYMKVNSWGVHDGLPFIDVSANERRAMTPAVFTPTGDWGVHGLVVWKRLGDFQERWVLEDLLQSSFTHPVTGKEHAVHVVIHDRDHPLLEIAASNGFIPLGIKAEAEGAPGLRQQRYHRPIIN